MAAFWRRLLRPFGASGPEAAPDTTTATIGELPRTPPPDAPLLGRFSFVEPPRGAEVHPGPTAAMPTDAGEPGISEAVRKRVPRRRSVRAADRGVAPLFVPGMRERAALYRLAAEQRARTEPEQAIALWKSYLELCPDDAEGWFVFGTCLLEQGRAAEAEGAFERTRSLEPAHAHAAAALGWLAGESGRIDESVRRYAEAVAHAPADLALLEGLLEAQIAAGHEADAAGTRARWERLRDADV